MTCPDRDGHGGGVWKRAKSMKELDDLRIEWVHMTKS